MKIKILIQKDLKNAILNMQDYSNHNCKQENILEVFLIVYKSK